MMRLQVDRDAVRLEHPVESIRNLLPDPFLNSETFGEQMHEPCQLGDADDVFVGDVTDVRITEEGQGMMLAQGKEADWTFDHLAQMAVWFAAAFGLEGFDQLRIPVVAL